MRRFVMMIFLACFTVQVFAQALPVSRMQNTISGVIQSKMTGRGFAANDPRFGITLQAAGSTIAGGAAAAAVVTAAAVTAPAWVTAAATVALGGLFAAGISLAVDGVKWLLNSDGSVTAIPAVGTVIAGGSNGDTVFWGSTYNGLLVQGSNVREVAFAIAMYGDCGAYTCSYSGLTWNDDSLIASGSNPTAYSFSGHWSQDGTSNIWPRSASVRGNTSGPSQAPAYTAPNPTPQPTTKSASDQAAALSDAEKAKPANPDAVAQIADSAWKKAAQQPGYAGVPYDASNPITANDVSAWTGSNPSYAPTVGDMVAPQPAPSTGTAASPWQLPQGSPSANTNPATSTSPLTNPGTGSQVNLGPDPGIGSPTMEATPTAQSVLDPILNAIPSVRGFVVPAHVSTCPTWEFRLWENDFSMDGQCQMAEKLRTPISVTMLLFFALAALLIVLAA